MKKFGQALGNSKKLFQYRIEISERNRDHFNGKKNPWDDRLSLPLRIELFRMALFLGFFLILFLKSEWAELLLLLASIWIWGNAQLTKESYYRVGYFDGRNDASI